LIDKNQIRTKKCFAAATVKTTYQGITQTIIGKYRITHEELENNKISNNLHAL